MILMDWWWSRWVDHPHQKACKLCSNAQKHLVIDDKSKTPWGLENLWGQHPNRDPWYHISIIFLSKNIPPSIECLFHLGVPTVGRKISKNVLGMGSIWVPYGFHGYHGYHHPLLGHLHQQLQYVCLSAKPSAQRRRRPNWQCRRQRLGTQMQNVTANHFFLWQYTEVTYHTIQPLSNHYTVTYHTSESQPLNGHAESLSQAWIP